MDLFPLFNSLRIASISAVIVFFTGIFTAYYIAKAPRIIKGILDVVFTLPLVLPPTVVGYLFLLIFSPKHTVGAFFLENFNTRLTMQWWSAIFAVTVVVFPLMYRTARGAFERFDENLADAGRTLGLSNSYIFWRVRLPYCKQGDIAGAVLSFARTKRRPSRQPSISCGAPATTLSPSSGC